MGREVTGQDQAISQFHGLDDIAMEAISCEDIGNPNICPTIEFERPKVKSLTFYKTFSDGLPFHFSSFIVYYHVKFVEMGTLETSRCRKEHTWNVVNKIQDKEYLEMSDQGLCLSLHQPYASLLVAGIKT